MTSGKDRITNGAPPSLAPGERWYVVQTQPRREELAVANLRRQGFRTFLPRLLKTVRHARRTRTVRAPLFPGYLFVPLDIRRRRWRCINGSFGVLSLIMSGERPLPVPHGVVEDLRILTGSGEEVDLGAGLRPGSKVRVLSGPFAELLGTLLELDDRGRARVLLEIMGAPRTVSLPRQGLLGVA